MVELKTNAIEQRVKCQMQSIYQLKRDNVALKQALRLPLGPADSARASWMEEVDSQQAGAGLHLD